MSHEVLLAIIGILIMIILIGLRIVWYRSNANNKGIYNVFVFTVLQYKFLTLLYVKCIIT